MQSHLNIIKSKILFPDYGCGINEIFQIETFIQDYCITLIDGNSRYKYYYKGPKKDKFIYILFSHSHYNVITNLATYLDISYYCNRHKDFICVKSLFVKLVIIKFLLIMFVSIKCFVKNVMKLYQLLIFVTSNLKKKKNEELFNGFIFF
jgi:hypothetical protein